MSLTVTAYCDSLFVKAKQKREAEGLSAFSAALEAANNTPIPKKNNSPYVYQTGFAFDFNDRKRDKIRQRSINGIVYKDPELINNKKLLVQHTIEAMPVYREARAAKRQEAASKAIYYYYYQNAQGLEGTKKKKKQRSINGIVYKDPELMNKKKLLTRETIQAMPRYCEALAAKQQEAASKAVYYYC
ncbi:hypothetical protein Tco_0307770 [Tanacetum coccineum]